MTARMMFVCPECGPRVAADEGGCCSTCGVDCRVEPYQPDPRIAECEQLRVEVERIRRSEESWNKEAERHERDHQAHYAEREQLRTEIALSHDSICKAVGERDAFRSALRRIVASNAGEFRDIARAALATREK